MKARGIGMDDELWELVDAFCAKENITLSEFFRRATCRVLMRPDLRRDVKPGRPRKPKKEKPAPENMTDRQRAGYARADALSPERRIDIARNAALARWGFKKMEDL